MSGEIHTNPSLDSSRHHLPLADKKKCTSDSGTSCNFSPSPDQLRSRTAKRPMLLTNSVQSQE